MRRLALTLGLAVVLTCSGCVVAVGNKTESEETRKKLRELDGRVAELEKRAGIQAPEEIPEPKPDPAKGEPAAK